VSPDHIAERRLSELGISQPKEIDVDLIAMDAGMRVEYEHLDGCEAMLVGAGSKAIATIKPSRSRGRERYSIGHELGHWEMHRGRSFRCRVDDPDRNFASDKLLEKEADKYAAGLLMPKYLFEPVLRERRDLSLVRLEEVATIFSTSVLATALRLADLDIQPVLIACYSPSGLRWHKRAGLRPDGFCASSWTATASLMTFSKTVNLTPALAYRAQKPGSKISTQRTSRFTSAAVPFAETNC
jgi:Zn-dependent peptidase ImmA (M78 family)